MTINEQLDICRACLKRKFDPMTGIVCSLTDAKPAFGQSCPDFAMDKEEAERLALQEKMAREEDDATGHFAFERNATKKGVGYGILLMVAAVVWFIGGLAAGYIFYYPPILFIVGVVALVRGASGSNRQST